MQSVAKMNSFIMSGKYSEFVISLKKQDFDIIPTEPIKTFPLPEQLHADMQILKINNDIFVLNEAQYLINCIKSYGNINICKNKAGEKYPENVLLNFLYLNNRLYGKETALDPILREYCKNNHIQVVNINQGYSRCSTLVINDYAVITADLSIAKAMKNYGVDVLVISSGNIVLEGYDYGFIGGASGKLNDESVIFFGNIKKHPDYTAIKAFLYKHKSDMIIACEDMPLTDIGGIVKI
ncbi:MAG: hypothetical protein U0L20_03225 [Ruminococcus sp.]|nr:hypothetical protein [Ruminococcus sp.]